MKSWCSFGFLSVWALPVASLWTLYWWSSDSSVGGWSNFDDSGIWSSATDTVLHFEIQLRGQRNSSSIFFKILLDDWSTISLIVNLLTAYLFGQCLPQLAYEAVRLLNISLPLICVVSALFLLFFGIYGFQFNYY